MIAAGVFDLPSSLLAWFYSLTHSYAVAIALIAVVVMVITAPLTLKSTKGMLEMQRLGAGDAQVAGPVPQRPHEAQRRDDEALPGAQGQPVVVVPAAAGPDAGVHHHVPDPLRVDLPPEGGSGALAQGIYAADGQLGEEVGFLPRYISHDSELFQSLVGQTEMVSLGLDLAKSPFAALGDSFGTGLIYLGLVVVLGVLYFVQQRMVAARAAVSPTMSPSQQKLMQYLPVAFAVFQVFFVLGLVIYYIAQAILRIGLQHYITRAFYGHDEALGRQAQRASEHARELAKQDSDAGGGGGGGLFAQARRDLASTKAEKAAKTAAVAGAAAATARGDECGRRGRRNARPSRRTARHRRATRRPAGPNVAAADPAVHGRRALASASAEEEFMEWVEVTAKSVESAKELALDRLGISVDDAEFDVVEEPRPGLFGRVRGEARVRARVKPTMVRQKQDRRGRRSSESSERVVARAAVPAADGARVRAEQRMPPTGRNQDGRGGSRRRRSPGRRSEPTATNDVAASGDAQQGGAMERRPRRTPNRSPSTTCAPRPRSSPAGWSSAFGLQATTSSQVDGTEIEVRIDAAGDGLGLLIGPSGRTLLAIQDLARVAAQRRLGDHETRLADRRRRLPGEAPCRPRAIRPRGRRPRQGVRRRPIAGTDAVVGSQGHPRHVDDHRRGRQPLRGRRSLPPDHRQPGVSRSGPVRRSDPDAPLVEALAASQRLGMLGAAPIVDVIDHSEAFVDALADVTGTVVDLGSGGGRPRSGDRLAARAISTSSSSIAGRRAPIISAASSTRLASGHGSRCSPPRPANSPGCSATGRRRRRPGIRPAIGGDRRSAADPGDRRPARRQRTARRRRPLDAADLGGDFQRRVERRPGRRPATCSTWSMIDVR